MSAQIHTRADGVAIDTFQVNDPIGEVVTASAHWARTAPELSAPRITLNNQLSDDYTVIEIKCPDRLGLLYLVTRTLSALSLDIATARIATEIDQALDSFYVHDAKGRKVDDPATMDTVRKALEQTLVQPL